MKIPKNCPDYLKDTSNYASNDVCGAMTENGTCPVKDKCVLYKNKLKRIKESKNENTLHQYRNGLDN